MAQLLAQGARSIRDRIIVISTITKMSINTVTIATICKITLELSVVLRNLNASLTRRPEEEYFPNASHFSLHVNMIPFESTHITS